MGSGTGTSPPTRSITRRAARSWSATAWTRSTTPARRSMRGCTPMTGSRRRARWRRTCRGAPYDVEFRLKCKSGEYRWFRARGQSVRNAAGRAVRLAGSLSDITDRKTAEAQLYAEKERAQVTLASIGDAVITTDTNGLVEYLNPVAEALTAWHLADAEGLPLEGLLQIVDEKTHAAARPTRLSGYCAKAARSRSRPNTRAGAARRRGDRDRPLRRADPRPHRPDHGRRAGVPGRQPRAPVRGEALLPGDARRAHRPDQSARVRAPRCAARCPAPPSCAAPPCGDVPGSRPVQGRQRHLRPCGRRRADAAD